MFDNNKQKLYYCTAWPHNLRRNLDPYGGALPGSQDPQRVTRSFMGAKLLFQFQFHPLIDLCFLLCSGERFKFFDQSFKLLKQQPTTKEWPCFKESHY